MSSYRKNRCKVDPEYKERCNTWARDYQRKRRHSEPKYLAKHYAAQAKTRQEARDYLDSLRSTLSCITCGENDPDCLDFHHRNPNEKDRNVTAFQTVNGIKRELEKCDVLCANCHRKLHAKLKKQLATIKHTEVV